MELIEIQYYLIFEISLFFIALPFLIINHLIIIYNYERQLKANKDFKEWYQNLN